MIKFWALAITLFLTIAFLFWRLTSGHFKKEYGEKLWKQWGTRLFYWQGVVYTSTAITILVLFLLQWATILTF